MSSDSHLFVLRTSQSASKVDPVGGEENDTGVETVGAKRDQRIIRVHLDWLRLKNKSDRTIDSRRLVLTSLAKVLPNGLLRATREDLTEWQLEIKATKSLATLSTYSSHVRAFYEWCVDEEYLDSSPARRLPVPSVPKGSGRPIAEVDFDLALACSEEPVTTWLLLGRFLGFRAVDIAGLEGAFEAGGRLVVYGIGKGGKRYKMPVPATVRPYVESQLRGKTGRPWMNSRGRPVSAAHVAKQINTFLHRIGIESTGHQLRHGYGTEVYARTKDIEQTRRAMRHSSIATTQVYLGIDEDLTEVLDDMSARLRVVRDEETGAA